VVVVTVVVVVATEELVETLLAGVVVVVVDVHAGKSTIQRHSWPGPLPVHVWTGPGRGSHEALALAPPPPMTIGPAASLQVLPSASRNKRLCPPRPSWHCEKPFSMFTLSVALPKPVNVLAQPSG